MSVELVKKVEMLEALNDAKNQVIAETYQVMAVILSELNLWDIKGESGEKILQAMDNLAQGEVIESVIPFNLDLSGDENIEEIFKTFGSDSIVRVHGESAHTGRYGKINGYMFRNNKVRISVELFLTDTHFKELVYFSPYDLKVIAV